MKESTGRVSKSRSATRTVTLPLPSGRLTMANEAASGPPATSNVRLWPASGSVAKTVPTTAPTGRFSSVVRIEVPTTGGSFTSSSFTSTCAVSNRFGE